MVGLCRQQANEELLLDNLIVTRPDKLYNLLLHIFDLSLGFLPNRGGYKTSKGGYRGDIIDPDQLLNSFN